MSLRTSSAVDLQVVVMGPAVDAEHAREVGAAYCDLFAAVADAQGATGVRLEVTGVKWMCDHCERMVPGDVKPARWVNRNGLDFCELCQ